MSEANRRLAGILAADVVGYSAMVGTDEPATLARVRTLHTDLIEPVAATYGGRLFKTTGDGFLIAFASAVQALRCAVAIQERLNSEPDGLRLRIGVHQGEVVADGDDLLGDGVIIVARLEPLAEPGGVCISARVREDAAGKMALEADDLGTPELKNIAAKIQVFQVRLSTAERPALPLPDKPSLVVLPFQNMSGDPEQEYFADSMVEEITTALCRIRWLFVIARNSGFAYKGKTIDVKQVGRDLGALCAGRVSAQGRWSVRITAQLIEAETAAHLWADRFDGSLEDVFELQERIATTVAGIIEPELLVAETSRLVTRPKTNLTAYDAFLRAYEMFLHSGMRSMAQALALLEEALARDPNYGPALAFAGICCMRLCFDGSSDDPQGDRGKGLAYGHRALQAAPNDPVAVANAAQTLACFGEDIGVMTALVDRALRLNPSYARGWLVSGILRLLAGEPEVAIAHCEAAARLSPRVSIGGINHISGAAHLAAGQFEEAETRLLLAIQDQAEFPDPYRLLASCYAHQGRFDDARNVIERLRSITPCILSDFASYRNPEQRELIASGLRLAAVTAEPKTMRIS